MATGRRGRVIREGRQVVIVGRPNTGKSSIFNGLVGAGRAIVTDVPGTTRDLVTETIDIEGVPVRLVDTAGVRETGDVVEVEGVMRARAALAVADLALLVFDRSRPFRDADTELIGEAPAARRVIVVNKVDLPSAWPSNPLSGTAGDEVVETTATDTAGIESVRAALSRALEADAPRRAASLRPSPT